MMDAIIVADALPPMPPASKDLGQISCNLPFEEIAQQLLDFRKTVNQLSETWVEGRRHSRAALSSLHRGSLEDAHAALQEVMKLPTLKELTNGLEQDALLSLCFASSHSSFVQDNIRTLAFLSFLKTGAITVQFPENLRSGVLDYDDEQYLVGLIGAARELERYALNRGNVLDLHSVQVSLSTVQSLEQALMQFDFRNSGLRRSFDGIKYTVKKLEEVCYEVEMALKRNEASTMEQQPESLPAEKSTTEPSQEVIQDGMANKAVDVQLLAEILNRYRLFDERREACIKRSRDVQKNAKNAVYALQRGNIKKSNDLLGQCARDANAIHDELVSQAPVLRRGGSFADSLEEFLEALALSEFVQNNQIIGPKDAQLKGGLNFPSSLVEYLGGILDLTGEVGRFAVRSAGKSDAELMKCMACVDAIYSGIQSVDYLPGAMNKKIGALRRTINTIENVQYEVSLLKSGRSRVRPPGEKSDGDQGESEPD
eukprot:gnl/MRDRNA2_/MRDRNA2_18517_c0_seq1.p1 gnl/MRDRNA2_/MRDRNA2_18517_c0~~gnl/MRDRNA2_/MRDRNA2_18517_c0_seq1.p1  ORF type:complete len:502 (+),score=112.28 gnl/MRDRNA2_/MRDRNA2_18517_c0_seq1:57-1508(+)